MQMEISKKLVQMQQDVLVRRQEVWTLSKFPPQMQQRLAQWKFQQKCYWCRRDVLPKARCSVQNNTWRTAAEVLASEFCCAPTPASPPATSSCSEDVSVSLLPIHVSASHAIKGTKGMPLRRCFLNIMAKIIPNSCQLLSADFDFI